MLWRYGVSPVSLRPNGASTSLAFVTSSFWRRSSSCSVAADLSVGSGRAAGFTARVIQHETDHLDGVLFLDRMPSFESLTFIEEFGRYWSGREVPAE